MIDPAVKTAMGLCVVLAAVCAVALFRRDPPTPTSQLPAAPLLIQSDADPATLDKVQTPSAADHRRRATLVKPVDAEKLPPPLAAKYPETSRPSDSHRGASADLLLPPTGPRTHKVVNGDTLAVLAQRFLGSAERAREIFDANRDVLSDPELLPIGAELKIPPIDGRQSPP